MSAVPIGYLQFREAERNVEKALFSGMPDSPEVLRQRLELGMQLGDGSARKQARESLWERAIEVTATRAE